MKNVLLILNKSNRCSTTLFFWTMWTKFSWFTTVIDRVAYSRLNWQIFSMMCLKKCTTPAGSLFSKRIRRFAKLTPTLMEGLARKNFLILWRFWWAAPIPAIIRILMVILFILLVSQAKTKEPMEHRIKITVRTLNRAQLTVIKLALRPTLMLITQRRQGFYNRTVWFPTNPQLLQFLWLLPLRFLILAIWRSPLQLGLEAIPKLQLKATRPLPPINTDPSYFTLYVYFIPFIFPSL